MILLKRIGLVWILPALVYASFALVSVVGVVSADTHSQHIATSHTPQSGTPGGSPQGGTPGTGVSSQSTKSVDNPLNFKTISEFISALLRAVIQIGLPIAVLFIVFAGFKFVAARGNTEKLADARRNFLWTVIGIAIFLGAWALAQLIAATLRQIGANV